MAKTKTTKAKKGGTTMYLPLPPQPTKSGTGPNIIVPAGSGLEKDPTLKALLGSKANIIVGTKKKK